MVDLTDAVNFPEYIKLLIGLLAIVDPIGSLPTVISLIGDRAAVDRQRIVLLAAVVASGALLLFTFAGETILGTFGISLSAFQVAGGVLLTFAALEMMGLRKTSDEAVSKTDSRTIAVVPIAIPLLAGPGALSTVIIYSQIHAEAGHKVLMTGVILAVGMIVYVLLRLSDLVRRVLGPTGMSVLNKVMGLLLLAIAIEFVADGIADHFLLERIDMPTPPAF